jgi:hypothetical protein
MTPRGRDLFLGKRQVCRPATEDAVSFLADRDGRPWDGDGPPTHLLLKLDDVGVAQ